MDTEVKNEAKPEVKNTKRELTPEELAAKKQLSWLTATRLIAMMQREVMRIEAAAGVPVANDILLMALTAQIVLLRVSPEQIAEAMAFSTKELQPAIDAAAKLEEQLKELPVGVLEQLARTTSPRFNPLTLGTENCTCGAPKCPGTLARLAAAEKKV